MSYNDDRGDGYGGGGYGGGQGNYQGGGGGGGGRGGYEQPSNPQEYGGGGRGGDNYYDQNQDYQDRPQQYEGGGGRQHYGGGGGDENFGGAVQHAQRHGGSNEDEGLFSQAASFLGQHKNRIQNEDVDEGQMVNAHQRLYGSSGGQGGNHDANTLGAGAAMQALKMFTGGGSGQGGLGGVGGNSQNQFIGMAMAQAGKLFDEQSGQGNVASGTDKQSVIQQAGEMALKMYMKGQMGGGGGGGGLGGLMGMASKFL